MAGVRVGLAGLGVMGWRIARNLRDAGLLVGVYNRTFDKALKFSRDYGVEAFRTPGELARASDVVITMLSDDEAVRSVIAGGDSVLSGLRPGSLVIDMSTISPSVSIELASMVRSRGGDMVDAPVIGTSVAVERKELVVLVGGSEDAFNRARDILQHTAKTIIHVGPNGYGLYAKLINNALLGSYVVALAEVVQLGRAFGLSDSVILDVLTKLSSARSPTSELKVPKMLSGDYSVQFALKHMRKDLDIVNREASMRGVPIPIASLALQFYRMAEKMGLSEEDFAAVLKVLIRR
ncbi:NAD(P)-dependent oxidoreductase [Vulcanisaeta sp. JCM 14467]|uniref:NAD(P)-dependent oxidoreductase n=1 Tax=Vulcanisaeta sp. JCM 14467 TaxID=1295370 RepID=UPI0006D1AA61|nr:NAD(P)-dependent oxidoreductase [Vulcanisaeta sp. JCM 14467]